MRTAIVFDCEYLAIEGSPRRFWSGPFDPDPTVVQIGAVRLGVARDVPILETLRVYVRPRSRAGSDVRIDPFLTSLTGVDDEIIGREGVRLTTALRASPPSLAERAAGRGGRTS